MLVLNAFLLVVGCLMDIMSAIMILVPLLAPLAALCGIDPIHLGIVFIVNLELGYLTPPMGLNLFVSSSIFEKSLGDVIKSVVPFTGLLLVAVLIVTYVPTVSLGPVNLLSGKAVYVPFPDGDSCAAPPAADDGEMLDDDDDDDDDDSAKGTSGAKSIGDLMKSTKGFDDAFDDDDDDDEADKKPKSIGELMKSTKGFDDAFDEDDDDEDDEKPKIEDKKPKSIGELMKSTKGFDDAFDEDDEDEKPKTPTPAPKPPDGASTP
jgi:C4-dicarboxylate transporter DctM subunit